MRRSVLAVSAAASLALAMSVSVAPGAGAAPAPDSAARVGQAPSPDKVTMPTRARGLAGKGGGGSPISYHGGPVMVDPAVHAYYIWYGSWDNGDTNPVSKGSAILENLASSIGGTPYFSINTSYSDGTGAKVKGQVTHPNSVRVGYPNGTQLDDAAIKSVVSNAIPSLGGPDPAGVYFVLTSADVNETSGFVTKYCGWHSFATIAGIGIKYSFVGDPTLLGLTSCAVQTKSPNGFPGADAMASVIAHELEEATTDPALNAWFDGRGYENADKCAWTFGTTKTATNGSKYNVTFSGTNYLIQRNWSAKTQACGMS